jgi:hypothetical protein
VRGHSQPEETGELPQTWPFPSSRLWGQRKTTLGALEWELTVASCIFVGMRKWVAGSAFCRKETGNRAGTGADNEGHSYSLIPVDRFQEGRYFLPFENLMKSSFIATYSSTSFNHVWKVVPFTDQIKSRKSLNLQTWLRVAASRVCILG